MLKKALQVAVLFALVSVLAAPFATSADNVGEDFETWSPGPVNGQHGWSCTGPYDVAVVHDPGAPAEFQWQSLRISNAVTSGSFGDQTFSYSLVNEAGEADAESSTYSGGTRQSHFEAQFSLASFTQGAQQPGLAMSVSPDRGDGARMSYLRFEDQADGIHVFFVDVPTAYWDSNLTVWRQTELPTVNRAAHTFKFSMDFVEGGHNDVVRIYVDGNLVHTGTSWEEYYREDAESNGGKDPAGVPYPSRTVDSLLFRVGGTAVEANRYKGFLIDNVQLASMTPVNFRVVPWVYDPGNTRAAQSQWIQLNLLNPDACKYGGYSSPGFGGNHPSAFPNQGQCLSYAIQWNHNADWVLNLEKNAPTSANVAAGASIAFGGNITLTELGFDYSGYCGAGAPRFNVYTTTGALYYFGCVYGTHTDLGNSWTRVLFNNASAYPAGFPGFGNVTVTRMEIVMDEQGQVKLDNIDVNGSIVGNP